MKKFTFMMIALLCAMVTFAAVPKRQFFKAELVKERTFTVKAIDRKAQPKHNTRRAATELVTPPSTATVETFYTVGGNFYVGTSSGWSDATKNMPTVNVAIDGKDMYIQGLAYWFLDAWIKGTIDGTTVTFASGQLVGEDEYGPEYIVGSEDGENASDFVFEYDSKEGILTAVTPYIVESGAADEMSPYCYWYSPVFSLTEPEVVVPEVVVAPDGLVTEEYSLSARNYKDDADVSGSVQIGFDGNDVYMQGICTYIPEAWVKGTLDGKTITFAQGQYFGIYGDTYEMYLNTLMGADVVFDYDAEAGTLTAQNEFFLVDNDSYYFDSYRGCVLKKVIEKAAMPADPAITAFEETNYGWAFAFNVPNVDVNGDGLVSSKLSYMIYTDTNGEVAPLTFTPATHDHLTEDMTEIPYGFTENWDFYSNQIYLNDLYSADWNKIGIQSIYRGGGEENKTEIQWYVLKESANGEFTFDFNAMDVPTSSTVTGDGDITEDKAITAGSVTLTISPHDTGTPNRFWGTSAGPQLRVYGGTLTFEVPEGSNITQIVFNHNGKWGENTADSGKITNDTEAKAATWTGEAQKVVVTIAANSQINSIDVTVEGGEVQPQPEDDVLVALPDGVEPIEYTLVLNGYTSQSTITAKDTKYVAFDGNDVYLQGLAYYFDEAYVKGTLDGNGQIIVESGQFVGEDEYGKEYLVGAGVDEEGNFFFEPQIVFNYDKESGKISLVEGTYYGESGTSDAVDLWDYFEVAEYTPGAYVAPEVVVLPEGVEPETWTLEGVYGGSDTQYATGVAFDGNDIYVQGLAYYFPEAWVKGTISDGIATFPTGQFVGSDEYGDEYLVGVDVIEGEDEDEQVLSDIKYVYDAEAKTLTQLTAFVAENDGPADEMEQVAPWGYWLYSRFFDGEPVVLDPVVAPEGLETEAYSFQATVSKETEDEDGETVLESVSYVKEVNVGFDGNDLYIQGISEDYPEGWVKATKNEAGQYVIPANQFMGTLVVESIFGTFEYPFHFGAIDDDFEIADAVLDYDAETNTISTEQMLVLNGSRFIVNPYQTFTDVTITKVIEMAGTPADPSFIATNLEGTNYPYVVFDIPTLDTDGNPMLNSKLFFTVWVEKNGPATPYTVQADEYENVENDMVEIPYTFDDNYDIYGGTNGKTFYFNPADEVAEFTNIGVQSIYYGGGETNKSDIIWMNGATTGVKDINTANNTAVYYDLQGRKVTASQKGLLIKQSRQDNGTITTVKVVRK